ncbi:uncharacterized protein BDZ99DRAFT_136033 [Mytilinidion resinicola]|uniref:Fatty acid hydroxylase domain-containing protein n=1 Tax=Mytilinidion resinicola TaxID=574789 RepID=A0A6A6Z7Z7_9PEZI|nr:uncharacterized protein BDZ99DRAFT_136033 [Mytilinidion resinicola]KAF2816434.1 hypothetical protein BDZ99DRAFT_136033 [Mytilinidion resinicola]
MGALLSTLSLPIASIFAIPMLSSWSTSLNLVFFSITWTTIAMTYAPLQIEFFAPLVIRLLLYILPAALFLLFDLSVPSLAVELKAQGQYALPGRVGRKKLSKVVAWSCFNILLGVTIQAAIEFLVTDVLRLRSVLAIKGGSWSMNHLPSPWTMVKNISEGLVLRNVLQYYIHTKLLHSPSNTRLTYWHQTWCHSIRTPFSFTAAYDHPVCYLLHKFLPIYLPAVIFRFHIMAYILLLSIFSLEEVFTHSGYNVLPSTIMLRGMARRTDAHMMSQGKGNFAPVGVLDWAHGTSLGADVMDDVQEEMEKHDVQQRAGKAANNVGGTIDDGVSKLKGRAKRGKGKK